MNHYFLLIGMFAVMNQPAHVTNSFRLIVPQPLPRAAALFGPEGERCWAGPTWDPHFLYPQPARDVEGAVFTIQHGPHNIVWVNTVFDPASGRMQYVAFIPDTMVTTVDVRLTGIDTAHTRVDVTYARTALDVSANDHVEALGKKDRENGPQWEHSIQKCLTER
jgi:hypothetical protein